MTKVLHDRGRVGSTEPFARLFTQGMITKDGAKKSKNKGNVVPPDELIRRYGADTERVYTLFIGPPEKDAEWNDRAVDGAFKFLNRVWRLVHDNMKAVQAHQRDSQAVQRAALGPAERALRRKTHQCIQKLRRDLSVDLHFPAGSPRQQPRRDSADEADLLAGHRPLGDAAGRAGGAERQPGARRFCQTGDWRQIAESGE